MRKLFYVWAVLALLFLALTGSFWVVMGVLISALSAGFVYKFRASFQRCLQRQGLSTKWKFIIIGSLGAFWLEMVFWVLRQISGEPITAHANPLMNLVLTMPWYIVMVALFWKVQTKYPYSLFSILMLGGVYAFFADGVVGSGFDLVSILLVAMTWPVFVFSYSAIVFPPSILLRGEIVSQVKNSGAAGRKKYWYGLLPVLGLLILIPLFILFAVLPSI